MSESILTSTKKILNIAEGLEAFDLDIQTHINSVLSTLTQLGVGPAAGYMITGPEETWEHFLGGDLQKLISVKTYVFLRVRLLFDPPTTSFAINSFQEQIKELEWRLTVAVEPALVTVLVVREDPFADDPLYRI